MSKEHPILFSGEMVRAILNGRKSQTRRTRVLGGINQSPRKWEVDCATQDAVYFRIIGRPDIASVRFQCPYGEVGDKLWVREAWRCTGGGDLRNIIYKAEGDTAMSFCGVDDGRTGILHVPESHWQEWDRLVYKTSRGCNWRSPIHMYKWAARIFLEITNIRVERAKDISEKDAKAEGMLPEGTDLENGKHTDNPYEQFAQLWDSLNKKRGFGWDKNSWVWVIEFKRSKNETL